MPAPERSRSESRRSGGHRSAVGAPGAVRVDGDFADEYPDADAASTEAYASVIRAGEALLAEIDRCMNATLEVRQPIFSALAVLDGAGEALTPSEIADRVLVASATMTATLDQQERRGWVRRIPNPADRRSVLVEITDEGRAVADRVLPGIRAVERSMMSVLTPEERTQLVAILDKILRRSAEIAVEAPTPLTGRRVRPARLG
ncbi:MAG: MarR family winged helix-turn-helix transcriptional regulator [Acidimicrobiia bacterium]